MRLTKEKYINAYVWLTQFFLLSLLYPIYAIFFDMRIEGREHFSRVKKPFIIISNHIGFYDSFMFRFILGFWTKNLPLRFMAVTKFNAKFLRYLSSIGIIQFVYVLFGAFVIVPGQGIEKNLAQAKNILDSGANVVIYPEGSIVGEDRIAQFRKGAAALAVSTQAAVVPVSLRLGKKRFFRRQLVMRVGEPIIDSKLSVDELNTLLRKRIVDQYTQDA